MNYTKHAGITLVLLLFAFVANARYAVENIRLYGKITDSVTKKGIEGVLVSDGYNFTQTDKKGEYKITSLRMADFLRVTVPSGYEIPVKNGLPCLYRKIDSTAVKQKMDFVLSPLPSVEENYRLIVFGDPQVYDDNDMEKFEESVEDMKRSIAGSDLNTYGIVCGDAVFDSPRLYGRYKNAIAETGRPFFHAIGNHDMTLFKGSDEQSDTRFKQEFGPTFYSFNRGKIHYVVLDDVMYTGKEYLYIGYINDRQLNWLKNDLSYVTPGSTVVIIYHIPAYGPEAQKNPNVRDNVSRYMQNREFFFSLLKDFNVHLFAGHMHTQEHYAIRDNISEHVHAGMCGTFWDIPVCGDGTPAGYSIYTVKGDDISWEYKAVGIDSACQFFIYPVGIDKNKSGAFVANVWNYDPQWKVRWYENGIYKGDMIPYEDYDSYIVNYMKNNPPKRHTWATPKKTAHLLYAVPSDPNAGITLKVTDRFGNEYTRSAPLY